MKKIYISSILIFSFTMTLFARKQNPLIVSVDSTYGYYQFKQNNDASHIQILNNNLYGLSSSYGFKLLNMHSDSLGGYYRYQQTFKNIPIEYSMFIIHHNPNGQFTAANGHLVKNVNIISATPAITANNAIKKAIKAVPAKEYYWQDSTLENELKREYNNQDTSYYPTAKLIITEYKETYYLCYKISVSAIKPEKDYSVYVNAINGNIVKLVSNIENFSCTEQDCVPGIAHTLYYGTQSIENDIRKKFPLGICRYQTTMHNCSPYTPDFEVDKGTLGPFTNGNNNWTDNNDYRGTTALWCIIRAYDYFNGVFGRNSYDGNLSRIKVKVVHRNYDAHWSQNLHDIKIGKMGSNNNYATTLDILGHEYTHGVTQFTANLPGSGEGGALNESFSDIFGTMIEFQTASYFGGVNANWLAGDELNDLSVERDMSDPNHTNQPDTYQGQYWDGEVHTDDGVQNYWFYLLAEGGTGTNDNGDHYCVQGIGRSKATRIAYVELTQYLTPNSDYNDARDKSILAAEQL